MSGRSPRAWLLVLALLASTAVMTEAAASSPALRWGPVTELPSNGESGWGTFNGVSCADSLDCTAVGLDHYANPIYATESNGSWSAVNSIPDTIGSATYFEAIDCPDASDCVAVGYDEYSGPVYAVKTAGTWNPVTAVPGNFGGTLQGVSCPTTNECTAVGNDESGKPIYVTDSAGVWTTPTEVPVPGIGGGFSGVSCTNPMDCTAVGFQDASGSQQGIVAVETAGVWTPAVPSSPFGSGLSNISCSDASDCTAVGPSGGSAMYVAEVAGAWGSPAYLVGSTGSFSSISCIDAADCTAIGDGPVYATESAGVWSSVTSIPGPGGSGHHAGINSLNCTSVFACVAVGQDDSSVPIYVSAAPTPGAPTDLKVAPGESSASLSWTLVPPANDGGNFITRYTATAIPGGAHCYTVDGSTNHCTIRGLSTAQPYKFQVVATNSAGSGPYASLPFNVYAISATRFSVEVLPVVVRTKLPFLVIAYQATPGQKVSLSVPGSVASCTVDNAGQCWISGVVSRSGKWNASGKVGSHSATSKFYAPSIGIPLQVQHGKYLVITIGNGKPYCSVQATVGGVNLASKTNASGSSSMKMRVKRVGSLSVTVTVNGTAFPTRTVEVY